MTLQPQHQYNPVAPLWAYGQTPSYNITTQYGLWSMLATKGGRLLAGANISNGNPSLYTSVDSGATWHLADSLNPVQVNGTPYCIKQDPVTSKVMLGCNSKQLNGLFTSTDDGKTWVNNPNNMQPIDIAFMNNKSYMTMQNGVAPVAGKYLMSSTDDFAGNWVDCTPDFTGPAFFPFRLLADNNNLFVGGIAGNGLYKTANPEGKSYPKTDNGITWSNPGLVWVQRLLRTGNYIFVATQDGVFRSADGGSNWTACNLGFNKAANDLAVAGTDLYVALKDSAVYKSSDNGSTWTSFHNGLPVPRTVRCMQVIGNYLVEGDESSNVYRIKLQ
ncbi:MAG: hypothetical protein QM726_12485 [Chitinophagaceae bacterium]